MSRRNALLLVALSALAGCEGRSSSTGAAVSASVSASPTTSAPAPAAPAPANPAAAAPENPNPLHLPPARPGLEAGRRVFTFPDQMLASAKPGSTLVLYAATVAGLDGDNVIVQGRTGPTYRVHPGYVIAVPDEVHCKPGDPVLTEHPSGMMKHAVVTKLIRDRIGVRFTDLEGRAQEALLLGGSGKSTADGPSKAARFVVQTEGLKPGNYAGLHQGSAWLHVLLVSASGEGAGRRWLALGFGGAAMVVAEADLHPIPVRFTAKPGSIVWAESAGKMRRATVHGVDDPGLFSVKFERAGRPATVGWGLLMAPQDG